MKLTAAQLAAIAAGATQEAVAALAAVVDLTPEQIAAAEAERLQAEAATAETARLAAEETARLQAEADTAAALAAASVPNPVVAHLTGQLEAAQAATLAAEIKASNYKAAADAQDGLLAIARASLSNMNIALGGSAVSAETFTAANIAVEHQRVDALFKSKFKVGGVAATAAPGEKPHLVDPMFVAAAKAFPQ